MLKFYYNLLVVAIGSVLFAQESNPFTYGMEKSSFQSTQTFLPLQPEGNCDQVIEIPDDLTNGTYLGGVTGSRVAVDIPMQPSQMNINQIKVSLASANDITYVHFKFHTDSEGLPGDEVLETTNTEIIAVDTLTYINAELGYLRTLTVKINEPLVLDGITNPIYWMEVVSDARAWGSNPYSEQGIGHGLAMSSNSFEWFELIGIESLYEIDADCTLGVQDEGNSKFNYYPNPVTNNLQIDSDKKIESILVHNALGQSVLNQKYSSNRINVKLSNLPTGVYFIKTVLENGVIETFKVVKK
jgi:hypothetical protein